MTSTTEGHLCLFNGTAGYIRDPDGVPESLSCLVHLILLVCTRSLRVLHATILQVCWFTSLWNREEKMGSKMESNVLMQHARSVGRMLL